MLSQIQLCHFSERLMNARLQLHCLYGCTIIFEARKPWICSTKCALVFLIPVLLKYAAKLQTHWFKITMSMVCTLQVELSKVSWLELRGTMLTRKWTLKMEWTAFMQCLCVYQRRSNGNPLVRPVDLFKVSPASLSSVPSTCIELKDCSITGNPKPRSSPSYETFKLGS